MPHSRSPSDDLLSLPPTLSAQSEQSGSPSFAWSTSEPKLDSPPRSLPTRTDSHQVAFAPHYSQYLDQDLSSQGETSPATPEGFQGQELVRAENSSDISFSLGTADHLLADASHLIEGHEVWSKALQEEGGTSEGHEGRVIREDEEDRSGNGFGFEGSSPPRDWYSKTFDTFSMVQQEEDLNDGHEGEGFGNVDVGEEQGSQYSFNFDAQSPTSSSSDSDQMDLSPLSAFQETPAYDWFAPGSPVSSRTGSQPQPRRANYGNDLAFAPSTLTHTPETPFFSFGSVYGSDEVTSGCRRYPDSRAIGGVVLSPSSAYTSFSAASTSLSPTSRHSPSQLGQSPVPLSPVSNAFSRSTSTGNKRSQGAWDTRKEGREEGVLGNRAPWNINASRRASAPLGIAVSPPHSALADRRFSCPTATPLKPISSPQLYALPCPSPNFRLDGAFPPVLDYSEKQGSGLPASQSSLIDLPALPTLESPASLPITTSSPESPPPPPPPAHRNLPSSTTSSSKKRRASTSSSTSSTSTSRPRSESITSESTILVEDPAPQVEVERISPITGKPTKVISKRSWPPKDAANRRYRCRIEGCNKSFGRPSALNSHARTHDGIKPFNCPIPKCARPFSVFSNLKRHMIIHPSVDFRSVSVNDLPQIHWVADEKDPGGEGGRLEWLDQVPEGGEAQGQSSTV
ncbi:hypothetical protein JCM16303_006936 [Sporobolomyces ruberrimus]